MVTWGIDLRCHGDGQGELSFYVLRFLLGVAEAGFFPGIILYLTYWYPRQDRGRFLAAFAIASPGFHRDRRTDLGMVLGLDGMMGLKGWQWLFIIEGIPSVLLGIVTWFDLTDRPERPTGSPRNRRPGSGEAAGGDRDQAGGKTPDARRALSSPKVITLSLIYFGFVGALYGMQFWLPQIVKAFGLTNAQTGWFGHRNPLSVGTIATNCGRGTPMPRASASPMSGVAA